MDEPAASLDPRSTAKLEESVMTMRGDYTVVAVTHELSQARRISDYLVFIYEGRIIEYGKTTELFEKPREDATREYLSGALVTAVNEVEASAN
jgi:phosphate transport system ATP-binding protein